MIEGTKTITVRNYAATHGCANFKAYVEAQGAKFCERKASGVYVIHADCAVVQQLALFAGYNAQRIDSSHWVVRRAKVGLVDYEA